MTLAGDLQMMFLDPTFRDTVSVVKPDGETVNDVFGMFQDVAQVTDPQAGPNVNESLASFATSQAHLAEKGISAIGGTADEASPAWYVIANGKTYTVLYATPDNATGATLVYLGEAKTS